MDRHECEKDTEESRKPERREETRCHYPEASQQMKIYGIDDDDDDDDADVDDDDDDNDDNVDDGDDDAPASINYDVKFEKFYEEIGN
ncbi:hypothetical protein PoB_002541800 [Plakobranchus ocellatus]|uniref:Uncharacterized protein n=1 Tax=Plakobranchus ocellatus TaxID=259542 RepID=A0AAV3ZVM4_9GAST|nr:hypothetical protein PoB_002541800 [Plakobranchus ocellatus]